jgi:hypothetical protein
MANSKVFIVDDPEENYTILYTAPSLITSNLTLTAGWNMVSFPVIPSNTSFSSMFSGVGYYRAR